MATENSPRSAPAEHPEFERRMSDLAHTPVDALDSLLPLCIPVDKLDAAMVQSASWKAEQVRSYILELRRIAGTPLGDAK